MTLDLFAILVNAVARAADAAEETQHILSIVLIGVVLGVGTWWALSIIASGLAKNYFSNLT